MIRQDYPDEEEWYLRGFIMQVFILLLKIVNFLLKQLDIEASKLEGRRVLNIIGVNVEEICLHLNRNRNDKKKNLNVNNNNYSDILNWIAFIYLRGMKAITKHPN